jgi:hypothetical protein
MATVGPENFPAWDDRRNPESVEWLRRPHKRAQHLYLDRDRDLTIIATFDNSVCDRKMT